MTRLFTRIRQGMLSENRFTRYVVYALGEIVLVVIGILIALEVGVVNDNIDRKELERKVLLEISNNLEGDLVDIESEQQNFKFGMQQISMSINHLRRKLPFHDSIAVAIEIAELSPHLSIKLSGYKMLEAKALILSPTTRFESGFPSCMRFIIRTMQHMPVNDSTRSKRRFNLTLEGTSSLRIIPYGLIISEYLTITLSS